MSKQAYMLITALMLVMIAGISSAKAQTGAVEFVANIPFAFSVGDKTMAAGEYTVRCVNPASPVKVLQVRSKDGQDSVLLRTSSVNGQVQDSARLVFYRYSNQYFFAQAWLPADGIGMQAAQPLRPKIRELTHDKRGNKTVTASTRR